MDILNGRRFFWFGTLLLITTTNSFLHTHASNTNGGSVYRDALEKSLLFFEAQRSGYLPRGRQRVQWRGDSGLKDGFDQGADLVGGYYDAGDNVKFGFPMAYAMTILSWGAAEFQKELATSDQLKYTLDAIKWGTDYIIQAHRQPNVLWAQVGDGGSDHYCWERPEDMSTPRTAYKVDEGHPGSDVAAESAAALAAASIAFRPFNSSYARTMLVHARQLFQFADTFRGKYDDVIPSAHPYYPSSGYSDELLWAAAWLFEATSEEGYLKYVVDNSVSLGGTGWAVKDFSWDNKYAGVQVLISKALIGNGASAYNATLTQYRAKAEYFLCSCLQKNNAYNIQKTPGGLLYFSDWANLQHVSAASLLLTIYSNYLTQSNATMSCPDGQVTSQDLVSFAQSQVDYILGKNPKSLSYVVGHGTSFPLRVHHRGASISPPQPGSFLGAVYGCIQGFERWFTSGASNPNVLVGALVGGPNNADEFLDQRNFYQQTEPSVAGNAPMVGLLAKLDGVSGGVDSYAAAAALHTTNDSLYRALSPVEFIHTITDSWTSKGVKYFRHMVVVRNVLDTPITALKLRFENLSGPIWGLLQAPEEKNEYILPQWLPILIPGGEFMIVYVQEGPQARISVVSYN